MLATIVFILCAVPAFLSFAKRDELPTLWTALGRPFFVGSPIFYLFASHKNFSADLIFLLPILSIMAGWIVPWILNFFGINLFSGGGNGDSDQHRRGTRLESNQTVQKMCKGLGSAGWRLGNIPIPAQSL